MGIKGDPWVPVGVQPFAFAQDRPIIRNGRAAQGHTLAATDIRVRGDGV